MNIEVENIEVANAHNNEKNDNININININNGNIIVTIINNNAIYVFLVLLKDVTIFEWILNVFLRIYTLPRRIGQQVVNSPQQYEAW